MTATEVKAALRRRHPAEFVGGMVGQWTCLEEFHNIDLLAISAWSDARRIGYEVKVSRSDLRRELLRPQKRAGAVAWCHEFYFAVPDGLLTPEEIAYEEPEWPEDAFMRPPCRFATGIGWRDDPGPCHRGKREKLFVGPLEQRYGGYRNHVYVKCDGCDGKGYAEPSLVEREAPTLWVPRDVGLVTITKRGCRVVKPPPKKPRKTDYAERSADKLLATIVRHASVRPDPRHREGNSIEDVA